MFWTMQDDVLEYLDRDTDKILVYIQLFTC